MKKLLSLALVLVMMLSMSVTAFATELTGGSGDVEITYTYVDSTAYVMTIPDSINLTTEERLLGTVSLDITGLAANNLVEVAVSSPNFDRYWNLLDENRHNVTKVPYTLKANLEPRMPEDFFEIFPGRHLISGGSVGNYSVDLKGYVNEAPAYSGNYKDILTFTASVVSDGAFLESSEIILREDTKISGDYLVWDVKSDTTLDLNGYSFVSDQAASVSKHLIIHDSRGGGKIIDMDFHVSSGGSLEVNGGSIENDHTISVREGASVVINGGTISSTTSDDPVYNHALSVVGTAEVNGGVINGNILTNTNGVTIINGGTVNGYLTLWYNNASVTVNGGTFTGGIYINSGVNANGKLEINGGTFTGGMTVVDGANTSGISIKGGTFDFDPSAYVNTETHNISDDGFGTFTVTALPKATYEISASGQTLTLNVPENASEYSITEALGVVNANSDLTTVVINGSVNDSQYETIKAQTSGKAVYFVNEEANNYISAAGNIYTCTVGHTSDEKYVLIANVLRSHTGDSSSAGTYDNGYMSKLTTTDPGARAILATEDAWTVYQSMVVNVAADDGCTYLLLGDTKWTYYKKSTDEWHIIRNWSGLRTSPHVWFPVFDVPLS